MIKQLTPLVLRRNIVAHPSRSKGNAFAILGRPFAIEYGPRRDLKVITVPEGFPTDLASVPRAFRWLISKTTGVEASVIHDWLYDQRQGTRKAADELFHEFLRKTERNSTAWIMYRAVRLGGQGAWDDGEPWVDPDKE